MFWHKKSISSAEYLDLFAQIEKLRIKIDMMSLTLDLTKKKLRIKKGIEEEEEEDIGAGETNKNPDIFLSPDGNTLKHK
jgi:hypothetical protein